MSPALQEKEYRIPMNDGVELDAIVCIPRGKAPSGGWPAMVLGHGHGDRNTKYNWIDRARAFAGRGIFSLLYSVRGQGASEGLSFTLGARELFDLQEVFRWMRATLPVNPDKIGIIGSSQGGWQAFMAAAHGCRPAVVVAENMPADNPSFAVTNGCLSRWFFVRTLRRLVLTAGVPEIFRQWALQGHWYLIREWLKPFSPLLFADRVECPVMLVHGWHDAGMPANDTLALFEKLPLPRLLYLGGGGHEAQDSAEAQELRLELTERWIDRWLLGRRNGIEKKGPIIYARRPDWTHQQVSSIPAGRAARTWYLHFEGRLERRPPVTPDKHGNIDNRLLRDDYDLRTAILRDLEDVDSAVQRRVETYVSAPLRQSMEILGATRYRFFMQANTPRLQVHADLYARHDDGTRVLISHAHHGSRTLEPGREFTLDLEGRAACYVVPQGARLELDVSNSNGDFTIPFFEPFRARLYQDNWHPSSLRIPLR